MKFMPQHPWPMAFILLLCADVNRRSCSSKQSKDTSSLDVFCVVFLRPEEIPSLSTFAPVFVVCWERFEIGAVKK